MISFRFKYIDAISVIVAILASLFLTVGSFAAEEKNNPVVQASGQRGSTSSGTSGTTGGVGGKSESTPIGSPTESGTMTSPRRGTRGY